jgi:Zn-dependent peptidase ImmA (M78 family)
MTWKSLLAEQLRQSEDAATVEEAALHLVQRKLNSLNLHRPPFDLRLIASAVGIIPDFQSKPMTESGRIIRSNGKHFIELNETDPRRRQRFTAAHEIAHKMLDGTKIKGTKHRSDYDPALEKAEEERICDLLASFILGLCDTYIQPVLVDRGYSFETIDHIYNTFDVSFEAAARSLTETCAEPVSVLFCSPLQNAVIGGYFAIEKFIASATFPFYIHAKTWQLQFLCLRRAIQSDRLIRTIEPWPIPSDSTYQCEFAAKAMGFYVNKARVAGVVVVVTSPMILDS